MIVCADDYGLAEDIDSAILRLASEGRLSAVSCMAVLERCSPERLEKLRAHSSSLDIGLHFCLTNEQSRVAEASAATATTRGEAMPSFGSLLRRSLARRIDKQAIRDHLAGQYHLFLTKCGRAPDFIDGHLHVHQLPVTRDVVLDFVRAMPPESRPYVRNTWLSLRELRQRHLPWVKAFAIGKFGKRMRDLLTASGVETNNGFAGIYDFDRWRRYPEYLPKFVDCLKSANGLLVVHPGMAEPWRSQEFNALRQFTFPATTPHRFQRRTNAAT